MKDSYCDVNIHLQIYLELSLDLMHKNTSFQC